MSDDVIYLDFNASTPCDPRVIEAMLPYFGEESANPASRTHRPGQRAFAALEEARWSIGRSLGAESPDQITFTSGATEANNQVLKGVAASLAHKGRHLITQVTEHPSVLEPLKYLVSQGWDLTEIGVDRDGTIRLDELGSAIRTDTTLASLMLANNETGTIQPIADAAEMLRSRGVLLHCDAAQGPGKLEVDVSRLGADYLTLSAHKVYGPKGIGVVCRAARAEGKLHPLLHGGGQENALRSGTSNVPAAVGFATALSLAADRLDTDVRRMADLRDTLESRIMQRIDGCSVNGAIGNRLPGTSNLSFEGIEGNALLASLTDLAVSSGSACSSAHQRPSEVLLAMGLRSSLAAASIRFSVGRTTTRDEIDRAGGRVAEEVERLRSMRRRRG
jgi:cysteine desulfurase